MAVAMGVGMMHRTLATITVSASVLVSSSYAHADEPSFVLAQPWANADEPSDQPTTWGRPTWNVVDTKSRVTWYGWQTLIGTVIFDALTVVGAASETAPLLGVGLTGRTLMAPTVHWIHGHGLRGLGSLGLQVGLPVASVFTGAFVGFLAEAATASPDQDVFGIGILIGVVAGGMLGSISATVVDTALLSTEKVQDETTSRRHVLPGTLAVVPMLDNKRFGLSLIGQF